LTRSLRSFRQGYFSDHIDYDVEQEAPTVERMKRGKNESKSRSQVIKNDINNSTFEEPQVPSNLYKDKSRESLSKKRNLSSNPLCAEETTQLATQNSLGRKKKKKKKKASIIKRILNHWSESRT